MAAPSVAIHRAVRRPVGISGGLMCNPRPIDGSSMTERRFDPSLLFDLHAFGLRRKKTRAHRLRICFTPIYASYFLHLLPSICPEAAVKFHAESVLLLHVFLGDVDRVAFFG